ncbi:MAG TPA: acetyl-CoA carboxylase biotin carboxyl carrier protein subunit [Solirubrobacteraceae bacterium]|jgi:acetyl-CoA carboxylase biotin carboxyl carrier protein|nr:acetyl-CoA carboxylase biotin carboxyl carrier protein subunit [Solirubrobacteraceae bacterium]
MAERPPAGGSPSGDSPDPSDLDRALELTRSLVDAIDGTSVSRLSVSSGSLHVEVERGVAAAAPPAAVGAGGVAPAPAPAPPEAVAPVAAPGTQDGVFVSEPESAGVPVTAQLVGVFYRRPEPGKPPLVEVGDRVEPGQPLAIVEAMKMMNEVVADVAGTVTSIHARDEDVVEFDQVLFRLDAAG